MIRPWPLTQSRQVGDYRVFSLRQDEKVSPRTGEAHQFYVLESADWVNVIALTARAELVMVEQYRHGTNTVELEVPGGMMDLNDTSPLVTAVRELREETGFGGQGERCLATIAPNPAIMNNHCHIIRIEACEKRHDVEWDSGEDLITRLVPVADLPGLIANGHIRHSISLVALYFFEQSQRGGAACL